MRPTPDDAVVGVDVGVDIVVDGADVVNVVDTPVVVVRAAEGSVLVTEVMRSR